MIVSFAVAATVSVVVFAALLPAGGTAAAHTTVTDACPREAYAIELHPWQNHGSVVVAVGFVSDQAPGCTLQATVHLTVRSRNGAIARLRGNPAVWRVATRLPLWSRVVHTWSWRTWCGLGRRYVITASANGQIVTAKVTAPPCHRGSPSRLINSGTGMRLIPFTGGPIAAHILPPETPIPLSPSQIRVRNAWLVADGRTLVAVYAGAAGNDPKVGLFAIVRQNFVFGLQEVFLVNVGQVGATTIKDSPQGVAVETSAQRGDIQFSSATGAHGVLHLADDAFELLP